MAMANPALPGVLACSMQDVVDDRLIYLEAARGQLPDLAPNNIPIALPGSKEAQWSGTFHMHLPFWRNDGTQVMMRVDTRTMETDEDKALYASAVRSEIATMRALRSVGLPVAAVYGDVMWVQHHLCFLIDKMPGVAPGGEITRATRSRPALDKTQIANLVQDLASFYVNLATLKYPFSGMIQPDNSIGPFHQVKCGSLTYHCKVERRYRTYRERMQAELDYRIPRAGCKMHALAWVECEALLRDAAFDDLEPDTHYILHTDDHAEQYLLDKDGHLTAVLDWEWAITTSKGDAFSGPRGLLKQAKWDSGSNEPCTEERLFMTKLAKMGRADLAACVKDGKKYQRVRHLFDYNLHYRSRSGLVNLQALRQAVTGEPFDVGETWEAWTERKWATYGGDARLQRLAHETTADRNAWFARRRG